MLPPLVVRVASAVLAILVLARMVMPALAAVACRLLFKLICPPSTVMGPAIVMALPNVMSAVLLALPKVSPVRVLANV